MNKQMVQSVIRKVLIAGLLVTTLLLLGETGYYTGLKDRFRPNGHEHPVLSGQETTGSTKPAGRAQPIAAMVCSEKGNRYGAAYHEGNVMAVFHRFSAEFGEALGSAGVPETISEKVFREYLDSCGVFLRFYTPQPLELLSAWLGVEMNSEMALQKVKLMYLCAEPSEVVLCFGTGSDEFFRCKTAVSRDGLHSRTAEFIPNGAIFAFENELLKAGDGYAVIMDGQLSAAVLNRTIPILTDDEMDALLLAVGMNSYVVNSYSEADGTVVFVEEEATLRYSPDGKLSFHRMSLPETNSRGSLRAAVDAAWKLAEQSIGETSGDALLLLENATYNESQRTCTVTLDYAVNGIPVQLGTGHAAELVYRGEQLIQAQLQYYCCTLTEETEVLLPPLQAAAIAAGDNAAAELVYVTGSETMNCIWVKSDG